MRKESLRVCFEEARGKCLLVALSGGADSVALLRLLHAQRDELGMTLCAAHFNHKLRGADADADEMFCRKLCEKLGVKLFCEKRDIGTLAQNAHKGIETVAREERYRFLYETADELRADYIALAHHADDQAETVLMHLLRGAGLEGACGMARVRDRLFRPLLNVGKAELKAYLSEIGQDWREDATNELDDTPRNALRNRILPELEKLYPSAGKALGRFAENARAENAFIDRQTESFMEASVERGAYGARILHPETADRVIMRRCLRRLCGSELDKTRCDALTELAALRRGRQEISGTLFAERTPNALYILPKQSFIPEPVALQTDGITVLEGICRITAMPGGRDIERDDPSFETVDADAVQGCVLRTRRAGDRIFLPGTSGSSLLSDRFTDMKLDRPLRDFVPVIAKGNEVLWAYGAGLSDKLRINGATKHILCLNIELL